MSSAAPKPRELDPKLAEAILRGLAEDIANGRVEVHALEKIPYKRATTFVVHYTEQKAE